MAFSMVKLWQSKLRHTMRQVLDRCLAIFSRVLSFPKKQERKEKSPRCSEGTLDVVVVHPTSSAIVEDVEGVIRAKQEKSREITLAVELPEDLLVEILHRLPVKSLVRFKSVSKEWKSVMESGYLAEKHLNFIERKNGFEEMKIAVEWSTSRSFCIKFFSKRDRMTRAIKMKSDPRRVPGSCNGLVCFYDFDIDSRYVYLFNPMTGVNRTLTPPRGGTIRSVGFGIDVVTGKYKVVLFYGVTRVREIVVFDLNTSKWTQRYKSGGDPIPLSCIPRRKSNPICVNGSLFWLLVKNSSEILAMNFHTEKFRILSLLNEMDMSPVRIFMWSFEDRLYVSNLRERIASYAWVLLQQNELSEKWERTKFEFLRIFPPILLNSSWFSQTLVSPYQPSSSTRMGSRQKQTRTRSSALFSGNGDTSDVDAPTEFPQFLHR